MIEGRPRAGGQDIQFREMEGDKGWHVGHYMARARGVGGMMWGKALLAELLGRRCECFDSPGDALMMTDQEEGKWGVW